MRLDQLITNYKTRQKQMPDFEIVIVETSEQVNHPERFNKVLDSEEVNERRGAFRVYHLERKNQN